MLLRQNLTLYRFFKITWRVDIMILILCSISYYIDYRLMKDIHIPPGLPALMGTALAFFIAFNNNQAYSRWWEARIIWGGLVNDSRSWARSLLAYLDDHDPGADLVSSFQRKMIRRHIGFLYALKDGLRRIKSEEYKNFLSTEDASSAGRFSNIPNAILDLQARDLEKLSKQNALDGFRFLGLNNLIVNFCDGMGKSERIKNTVFPTTYVYFTRFFIWLFVILSTMSMTDSLGPWSILFGWVTGFVFHSTHINGMSIMNPFEMEPPCIPLNSIVRTIEINLLEALGEKNIPDPEPTQRKGEYVL
jgi:ion channel-forming bestrophin family protein